MWSQSSVIKSYIVFISLTLSSSCVAWQGSLPTKEIPPSFVKNPCQTHYIHSISQLCVISINNIYLWRGFKSIFSQFLKAILKIVERFSYTSKIYCIFVTQCAPQREFQLDEFGLCRIILCNCGWIDKKRREGVQKKVNASY